MKGANITAAVMIELLSEVSCVCSCVCASVHVSPVGQSLQTQPVRLSMESPTHRSHDSAWEQSAGGTKLTVNQKCQSRPNKLAYAHTLPLNCFNTARNMSNLGDVNDTMVNSHFLWHFFLCRLVCERKQRTRHSLKVRNFYQTIEITNVDQYTSDGKYRTWAQEDTRLKNTDMVPKWETKFKIWTDQYLTVSTHREPSLEAAEWCRGPSSPIVAFWQPQSPNTCNWHLEILRSE